MKTFFIGIIFICTSFFNTVIAQSVPTKFKNPPREFSVMPFWFWNDTLKANEIPVSRNAGFYESCNR